MALYNHISQRGLYEIILMIILLIIFRALYGVSYLNFGVTRHWSPKSLDLGVRYLSILFLTPKSKDLGVQLYHEI